MTTSREMPRRIDILRRVILDSSSTMDIDQRIDLAEMTIGGPLTERGQALFELMDSDRFFAETSYRGKSNLLGVRRSTEPCRHCGWLRSEHFLDDQERCPSGELLALKAIPHSNAEILRIMELVHTDQ